MTMFYKNNGYFRLIPYSNLPSGHGKKQHTFKMFADFSSFMSAISFSSLLLIIPLLAQQVASSLEAREQPLLQFKSSNAIRSFLLKHSVIPDAFQEQPRFLCEVRYTRDTFINLGNKVDPAKAQRQPRSLFWPSTNETFYTLVFVDLDVPSRRNPIYRDRQHWIVGNIPGTNITLGDQMTEYLGPIAPRDSGMHRYVFIVYQQSSKIIFTEKKLTSNDRLSATRSSFSLEDFNHRYNLGAPYAANFFLTGWPLNQDED